MARSESTADREIVITRVLSAPRELAFEAWTDAKHISNWWGPRGFTTTTHFKDVRPGGAWDFIMHGPDGRDYKNRCNYIEVVKPERLVYDHLGDGDKVHFRATITFEDLNGKTKLTMRSVFPTAEDRDLVVKQYGAIEGGNQTLARLDEHLAGAFVIARSFKAPLELVWKAWTERERLEKWFGPRDMTIPRSSLDPRPGGLFHYCLRNPDGKEMWGKWVFRDITPRERLVFLASFSDEQGGVTRHPLAANWPQEMLSTVTFSESHGLTTVMVHWLPHEATEQEREAFRSAFASMNQGWTGTFDKLEAYLAKA
jgi:uncharacterized protein YndB with AHSA1/START domain